MKDVGAIVLAAGRSSRMGAFKPLLPFGDQTVIETCLQALNDAGAQQMVVVVGHRGDEIRRQLEHTNVTIAVNDEPDSPMSSSIRCGIEQLSADMRCVLITPVDHPAVPTSAIEQIIDEWTTGQTMVQPEHNGRGGHPVLIDLSYRKELQNLDQGKGLRAFFESHRSRVRRLPVDSPFIARDMDTWEDYVTLHRDVFGRLPRPVSRFPSEFQ